MRSFTGYERASSNNHAASVQFINTDAILGLFCFAPYRARPIWFWTFTWGYALGASPQAITLWALSSQSKRAEGLQCDSLGWSESDERRPRSTLTSAEFSKTTIRS